MHSLGKMLVKFSLQGREHSEDMHIYPNVSGIIISWKAAKALGILPEHYPNPIPPNNSHGKHMSHGHYERGGTQPE